MTIIGIDLGTTNSACSIWTDEGVKLIPNRLGDILTPSVVGIDSVGKVIVGKTARERLINHSQSTVASFKRLMGTEHQVVLGKQKFTAIELSSLLLQSLKEDAETYLEQSVTQAVISVPAYFNDNQRQATKLAGELAGLNVMRLINEPTAAAISYGLHEKPEGTFIILDMGGGTFDVSILEFFDGVMEVHASAGDNFLGGDDFVNAMITELLQELGLNQTDLDEKELQVLHRQIENAKRSINNHSALELELQLNNKVFNWTLTSDWFIQVCTPLILRAKRPIETALRDANLSVSDIDDVILVGGSTRLSIFRSTIGRLFARLPASHLDPDTVIAMGTGIQAGLLERNAALDDIVLTDVCPYSLGTAVINRDAPAKGGYFLPIIERNTVVPVSLVRRVYTTYDGQATLKVSVYQGENRYVSKNVFLGDLDVPVPKAKAGAESIDIRYSYDMNGLLEIDIQVVSSGEKYAKVIERAPGSLTEQEKQVIHARLEQLKFHPREDEANQRLLARGERLYEMQLGGRRDYIAHAISQFERLLSTQNKVEITKGQQEFTRLMDELEQEDHF